MLRDALIATAVLAPLVAHGAEVNPCVDKPNQTEMNICIADKVTKADVVLDQVFGVLRDKLDALGRRNLVAAEKAWIVFRDRECELRSGYDTEHLENNGTIMPLLVGECRLTLTQQRTADLQAQVKCPGGDLLLPAVSAATSQNGKTMRGALIGCGFFAQNHLNAWRDMKAEGVELVAVCDIDPAKAKAAAEAFGIARHYTDPRALFASERSTSSISRPAWKPTKRSFSWPCSTASGRSSRNPSRRTGANASTWWSGRESRRAPRGAREFPLPDAHEDRCARRWPRA